MNRIIPSRRLLAAVMAALIVAGGVTHARPASAAPVWGSPTPVSSNPSSGYSDLSCPSASQCTLIRNTGEQVTFNPSDPIATASGFQIDPETTTGTQSNAATFSNVACPTASLCVAAASEAQNGVIVPFNPEQQATPEVTTVMSFSPASLSCPTAQECVAVSYDGQEVTFDPSSPGSPVPQPIDVTIYVASHAALSCATASQCTAVGTRTVPGSDIPEGAEATFNPQMPSTGAVAAIDTGTALINGQFCFHDVCPDNAVLNQVSCPAADECIASDVSARLLTFDPQSVGTPSLRNSPGGKLSCPSEDACLEIGDQNTEFDPLTFWAPSASPSLNWASPSALVSCPTTGECVVSNSYGGVTVGTGLAGPSSPPPPSATARSTGATARAATVDLECYAAPTDACAVTATLLVHETVLRGRVRAVSASRRTESHRVLVLSRAHVTITGGAGSSLRLPLNAAGRRLLKQRRAFTASLIATVSGVRHSSIVRFVE